MNENVTIKTVAFGGFDRDEVLQYIDHLNQSALATQQDLNQQIQNLTQSRQELSDKVATFEQRISDLEEQLESERDAREQLLQEHRSLERELKSVRADKEQSARSLALEQEKNRQLVNRMSTLESNASKYDEACAQVGAALLDAHQDAQRIREKARREAAVFTDGAVQTAQSVMDGVNSLRSNLDAVRDRIRSITTEFETQLGNIYQCLEDAATQAETFRQNLQQSPSVEQDPPSSPA